MAHGGQAIVPGNALYPWYIVSLWGSMGIFFIAFWSRAGETLGMRAWGLRLVTANGDGTSLSLGRASWRLLAMVVGLGLGGLGIWWGLWDSHGAMLHDHLAGTRVMRLNRCRRAQRQDG